MITILDRKIEEGKQKAENSPTRRKYIMFGYHKAIAVHLRKVKKDFEKIQKAETYNPESSRTYRTKRLYPHYSGVLEGREFVLTLPRPTLPRS